MTHNFKNFMTVMTIICVVTVRAHSQSADTLKTPSLQEKAQTITLRMERELLLTRGQSTQLMNVLTDRFRSVERLGTDARTLETVNRTAIQKLSTILTDKQYALYLKLRETKKRDKEKYLKEHPGFILSAEDLEMDF